MKLLELAIELPVRIKAANSLSEELVRLGNIRAAEHWRDQAKFLESLLSAIEGFNLTAPLSPPVVFPARPTR